MRRFLTMVLVCLPLGFVHAEDSPAAVQADALHDKGMYREAQSLLRDSVTDALGGKELAELYWRAARETLELGDIAEKDKKPQADILALFAEGEGYADKAIAADPQNDQGYYWKSANIGRWGQVKGIFDSLSRAAPMKDLLVKELAINPDRSDPYFVLGQLYRELPGWPLSFGNIDAAVSLGRKAVELRQAQVQAGIEKEQDYDFYNELAKSLRKRDWSASKRVSEQKAKAAKLSAAGTPLEKGSLYEATAELPDMSDREEAKSLVQFTASELGSRESLTASQAKDLEKARALLKGW
jgi:tetratricopeptide (TPR) repeat protein